ncbi:MAG: hypothetical protein ACI395_10855 [Candidatus Cryptobacteroides sp.]
MKRLNLILSFVLTLLCGACSTDGELFLNESGDWSLKVDILNMQGLASPSTKVSYSGPYGEHTEFETGDFFGLFVLDAEHTIKVCNYKVYCSGLDNDGKTVWSIFKSGSSDSNTSNHPMADVLAQGTEYFAYFPYKESFNSITTYVEVKSIVPDFLDALPKDQSSSYTDYDLIVASNIPGCEYGEVGVSGKSVSLTLAHTAAMLRYCIPTGSVKYDYKFDGADFTPFLLRTVDGVDEFRYIFKAGCVFDLTVKYVIADRLYRIETGIGKDLWPVTTEAGHCYLLDENAPKVGYTAAVDMGTSVMWSTFNLGAESDLSATPENISLLKGRYLMWGVNTYTGNWGNAAYTNYSNSFTSGTPPKELPAGYDYSGDARYDAATNLWGGKWRTPTYPEWEELYANCTYSVSASDSTMTLTSKTTGKSLKFKYAGYTNGGATTALNFGYYWSSTSNPDNIAKAKSTMFRITDTAPSVNLNADRYTGLPIRPVYTK